MITLAPINPQSFSDGHIRTFRQKEIPEFSVHEKQMLKSWLDKDQLGEIVIYLTMDKFCGLDAEMAEFMLREILRNNI